MVRGYLWLRIGGANTDRFDKILHHVVNRSGSALSSMHQIRQGRGRFV